MTFAGAVNQAGQVFMWGDNTFGQLGVKDLARAKKPITLQIPQLVKQISVSKGEKHCHAACVTQEGAVLTWGDHYKGQLGTLEGEWTHEVKKISTPLQLSLPSPCAKVMCGGIHNSAMTINGELYTWGCGSDGRLGHPDHGNATYLYKESHPKKIDML